MHYKTVYFDIIFPDWHIRSISRIINASKKYYCVVRDIDAFKLTECELEMHFFCEDKGK